MDSIARLGSIDPDRADRIVGRVIERGPTPRCLELSAELAAAPAGVRVTDTGGRQVTIRVRGVTQVIFADHLSMLPPLEPAAP
jgi:hypothetical protein